MTFLRTGDRSKYSFDGDDPLRAVRCKLPGRVAFYRLKYYDSGGSLIFTGGIEAVGAY